MVYIVIIWLSPIYQLPVKFLSSLRGNFDGTEHVKIIKDETS